jgi:putative heme-binding domain-containing protein
VVDATRAVPERVRAARQLVALDDSAATLTTLAGLLEASALPAFSEGVVDALATSVRPEAGTAVLARWTGLGTAARRLAVGMLCQRGEWTRALLGAIEAGELQVGDVDAPRWQLLEQHPDAAIAARAQAIHGRPAEERAALVAKLMPVAERAGDAASGKALFAVQCAACHQLDGVGGVLGPHLDGVGARSRRETLVAILDPNQSVEANYVLWIVATKDGKVFSGRLDAETRTTIELLDLVGQKQVIQRSELHEMRSANRSLMPDTFHLLGEQGLADLLEFLAQAHGAKK